MKNLKKLFVLALAVIMCLTAISITSFAADFNPQVFLNRKYDTTNELMYIAVTTDKPYGAMKASLTFPEGVEFNLDNSKFAEQAVKDTMYVQDGNMITFAVATDKLTGTDQGTKAWALLCFDLGELKTATFTLSNIQVADINEDLKDGITVPSKTITVDNVVNSLGAQYRKASGEKRAALRFGAKLIRNKAAQTLVIDNVTYNAISCGYIIGYSDKIGTGTIGAALDSGNNVVPTIPSATINKIATKYTKSDSAYLIYTLAVTFGDNSPNLDREIQALPYVKYKAADSNTYYVATGDVIYSTYNTVANVDTSFQSQS